MPNLVSPGLVFSRDGRTLVELEPDALLVVDPDAGLTARIAFARVRDGRPIGASVALARSGTNDGSGGGGGSGNRGDDGAGTE